MLSRRRTLVLGGGFAAALLAPAPPAPAATTVAVTMRGDAGGAHVGYDPVGLLIRPGATVRWTNADAGNAHTATAYSPTNGRPRRIPAAAEPWDSGALLPEESFAVTLTEEGVYDFYCVPHEHAGMVGRIVVGNPDADGWLRDPGAAGDLPEAALGAFPLVAEIVAQGTVRLRWLT